MFKKIKKIITTMLILVFVTSVISPITAQANSLPDWFNDAADMRENVFGLPYYLDDKQVSRERYYEFMGLDKVKDPDKLYMTFAMLLPLDFDNHKPALLKIFPAKVWDPYYLPYECRKWLQLRVYDDKGNLIIGQKRAKSHWEVNDVCEFNWSVDPAEKDLSHLREGVYVIEWRCKYKDITTEWEKVPVVTSTYATRDDHDGFRWNTTKHVKAYDVYVTKAPQFEGTNLPGSRLKWKKVKTVKKNRVDFRKWFKVAEKDRKHEYLIAVIPKAVYKGKPVPIRIEETFYYYLF